MSAPQLGSDQWSAVRHERYDACDQRKIRAPRPAEAARLYEEAQEYEDEIDSGEHRQELVLRQPPLLREFSHVEQGDQDVEHEHNGIQHGDEEPAVRGERRYRERAEAEPRH